jgi:hypothetical protein
MVDGVIVEGDRGGRWDLEKWRWGLRKKKRCGGERKKKRNLGGRGYLYFSSGLRTGKYWGRRRVLTKWEGTRVNP